MRVSVWCESSYNLRKFRWLDKIFRYVAFEVHETITFGHKENGEKRQFELTESVCFVAADANSISLQDHLVITFEEKQQLD